MLKFGFVLIGLSSDPAKQSAYKSYSKHYLKKVGLICDLRFLKSCLELQILPSFTSFRVPRNGTFSDRRVGGFRRKCLLDAIRAKESEITQNDSLLTANRLKFIETFSDGVTRAVLSGCILRQGRRVISEKTSSQSKKLEWLSRKQDRPMFAVDRTVKNFTDIVIPEEILRILRYGPRHPVLTRFDGVATFTEFEKLAYVLESKGLLSDDLKSKLTARLHSYSNDPGNKKIDRSIRNLKEFVKANDLKVVPYDKGCGFAVIRREEYEEKMAGILRGPEFKEYKPAKNAKNPPQIILENRFNATLLRLNKSGQISDELYSKTRSTGGQACRMYGLIKVHKEGNPLRPIASLNGSIYENLANELNRVLTKLPESQINCQNFQVVQDLRTFSSGVAVSYDVKSLFTMVPLEEAIDYTIQLLDSRDMLTEYSEETMRSLLLLATKDVLVEFGGQFHLQIDGVAMGSSLGPTLANIFMSKIESEAKERGATFDYYTRYVDDCFSIVPDLAVAQLNLSILNQIHPKIQFTIETETDGVLAFLDIEITNSGSGFSTTLYKKPTDTSLLLNFHSASPMSFKRSLVTGFVSRIFNLTSDYYRLHHAIGDLRSVLQKNQYPTEFFDPIIRKKLSDLLAQKHHQPEQAHMSGRPEQDHPNQAPEQEDTTIVFKLQYRGPQTDTLFHNLRRLMPSEVVLRCVSSSTKLRDIVGLKSPIPVEERSSIVYSLSCSCGALYVGRTCRHLVTRINEHQKPGGLANVHQRNCQLQNSRITFGVLYSRARTMFSLSVAEACMISSRRPQLNSREERSYEFILPMSTF